MACVMRPLFAPLIIAFAVVLALLPAPMAAQQWAVDASDDGAYAGAFVRYPGLGMEFFCAARSVQNLPVIDSQWFEVSIAPPWQFQIGMTDQLIPMAPDPRSDIVLFVDQTGYRLPDVYWDEMGGGWGVSLSMTDTVLAAMRKASRFVLQIGAEKAWELPVTGLGAGLEQAAQFCGATWVATGNPVPPGFGQVAAPASAPPPAQGSAFTLPAQVQSNANRQCLDAGYGQATISATALQAGDLDGDGQPDVVMNWREVTCAGQAMNPFCGAANCSIEVYMSSRGYLDPLQMLGMSSGITAHHSGRLALQIGGTYGLCGETGCDAPWLWNGADLVQAP